MSVKSEILESEDVSMATEEEEEVNDFDSEDEMMPDSDSDPGWKLGNILLSSIWIFVLLMHVSFSSLCQMT